MDSRLAVPHEYKLLEKIGQGTYGTVFLATHIATGRRVALKRMTFASEDEGIPCTALREVALLRELSVHQHIVDLQDVIYARQTLFLIFEFVDRDLKQLMDGVCGPHGTRRGRGLPLTTVRNFLWQLLQAIHFCHSRRILHRDLKPQNILVQADNTLKLADFGLGRTFTLPLRPYSQEIVTLWYRSPEVLLGTRHYGPYGPEIDMWSCGAIFAEMLFGAPLFPGDAEVGQLFCIFQALGTPEDLCGVGAGSGEVLEFPPYPIRSLRSHFDKKMQKKYRHAFDLMEDMLKCDPKQRVSARAALNYPFLHAAVSPQSTAQSSPQVQPALQSQMHFQSQSSTQSASQSRTRSPKSVVVAAEKDVDAGIEADLGATIGIGESEGDGEASLSLENECYSMDSVVGMTNFVVPRVNHDDDRPTASATSETDEEQAHSLGNHESLLQGNPRTVAGWITTVLV